MPDYDTHLSCYKHNRKLLDSLILNKDYNDWEITVIFYCAVHLIEGFFSKSTLSPNGLHSDSHRNRFVLINKFKCLKRISGEYQALYNLSILSRYEKNTLKNKDVQDAKAVLKKIETSLNN